MVVVEEEEAEFGSDLGWDLGFGSVMRSFLEGEGEEEGAILK